MVFSSSAATMGLLVLATGALAVQHTSPDHPAIMTALQGLCVLVVCAPTPELQPRLTNPEPILVTSPPPGLDFSQCQQDQQTGHCCIDFVSI